MGYFAAFLVILFLIIGIYCFGYAARKSSLLFVLFLESTIGLVVIFPLLLFYDKLDIRQIFVSPRLYNWAWLFAAAAFGYLGGNYFSLLNLRTAGEKINSLLSPAITAFTIILSYFFLKEKLFLHQEIGVFITLCVIVTFLSKRSNKSNKYNKAGFISGLLCITCISLTIICSIKGVSNTVTFLQAIWIRLLIAFFMILPLFLIKYNKQMLHRQNVKFYLTILVAVLSQTILANYFWFYASFHIGVDIFQTILATLPLWLYAADVYILKKSKPSFSFLSISIAAAFGIFLVMI